MYVREAAARSSASVRSFSASSLAADVYCGIANGVSGAFGFIRGLVAIHASTAGLNSARKRLK